MRKQDIEKSVKPCPSREVMVLSVDRPTEVKCSLLEGHDGDHVVHMEWRDA